jgi:hypothetical protein
MNNPQELDKNISKILILASRKDFSEDERDFWHRVAVICMRHWDEMEGPGEASEDRKERT